MRDPVVLAAEPRGTHQRDAGRNVCEKALHRALVCHVLCVDETACAGMVCPCCVFENAQLLCELVLLARGGERNGDSHVVQRIVALLEMERKIVHGQQADEVAMRRLRLGELGQITQTVPDFVHNVTNVTGFGTDQHAAFVHVVCEPEPSEKQAVHRVAHNFRHQHVAGIMLHSSQAVDGPEHLHVRHAWEKTQTRMKNKHRVLATRTRHNTPRCIIP